MELLTIASTTNTLFNILFSLLPISDRNLEPHYVLSHPLRDPPPPIVEKSSAPAWCLFFLLRLILLML